MAYNITKNYKQVIYSGGSRHKIKILFNNVELQEADRYCKRATIKSRIIPNGAKRFSLNNFISKEVEIILHDIDTSIIQDKVSISIGTLVGNSYEYVPIGIFNIQGTPTTDKNKITIKLRDNSVKFDFNYNAKPLIDEKGGSATKLQILQDICSKANVTCNITSFLGSTDSIGIYDNTITARQYIADIAEQAGKIATINRNGELIFVNLNSLTTWNIPLSIVEKYEIGKAYRIGKVVYEDAIRKYETASTNYDTLYLDASNPYISSQEQVNSILQQVNNFAIDSVKTGKILGNPAIDSYDLINIYNDKVEGNPSVFKTLATNELVYTGVLINTFNTQIGEEERKENVTVTGEATFKKWATTNINNINGEIDIQAGKIDNVEKEINPTQDATGTSFYLEDSTNAELVNFEMEGKTTQATRSGYNLVDLVPIDESRVVARTNWAISEFVYDSELGRNVYHGTKTASQGGTYPQISFSLFPNQSANYRFNPTGKNLAIVFKYKTEGNFNGWIGFNGRNNWEVVGVNSSSQVKDRLIPASTTWRIRSMRISKDNDEYTRYSNSYKYMCICLGSASSLECGIYVSDIMVVEITDEEYNATTYTPPNIEKYGIMPSPDYPSELVSVGYENLFDGTLLNGRLNSSGSIIGASGTANKHSNLIKIEPNTNYTYSCSTSVQSGYYYCVWYDETSNFISSFEMSGTSKTAKSPLNAKYISISIYNVENQQVQLTKGTQVHSYIPYGKYGIEVKTTGKNLFDGQIRQGSAYSLTTSNRLYSLNDIIVQQGKTYTISTNLDITIFRYAVNISTRPHPTGTQNYDSGWKYSSSFTFTATLNGYLGIPISRINDADIVPNDIQGVWFQVEENNQATSKNYSYALNQPLRSIGDTKDLLYIKNGMLYVERKIGSKILDGSETWNSQTGTHTKVFNLYTSMSSWNAVQSKTEVKCEIATYSVSAGANNDTITNICAPDNTGANFLLDLSQEDFTSTNAFETWLSTHNTEVQYILASSNTEGVGKIEVPSTYKTITHIDTTDELEPNMNITYVMNTQITNYVQNQVNQIKITEDGILAEVNRKVDNEEIIAKLNLAIEDEQGIIEITGNQVTIDSDYFKLNANGTIKSTGGTIGGYKITDNMLYAETFAKYNYTERDLDKIRNYLMGTGTLTPEEFEKYDVDESGTITSHDFIIIKFFIKYNVTPTSSAKIIMRTGNSISDNAYVLQDGAGNEILNIGFNGIYYKDINLANTNTYSENELVVGKWIDNKPIYRKVIGIGNLPNASQTIVSHNISNIERIVKLYGSATRDRDKDTLPIPYVTFNSNNSGGINLYANNVSVFVSTSSDRSSYTGYVVLEYTKTSD